MQIAKNHRINHFLADGNKEIDYYLATDTEQVNELTVESDQYTIVIEGGTFNINTVDDSIHANSGSVLVYGGNLTINTADDGIHAVTL